MKTYDELLAERDALAHRFNDVSIACKVANSLNDKLQAERDALAARVIKLESLRDSGEARLELITDIVNAVLHKNAKETSIGAIVSIGDILDADRSKCLAEIKAEAGRAGFIAGACGVLPVYSTMELADIEADARNYAAKIRNTGTWLRDENVNGGKRPGHCKFCLDKVYPDDDYKIVDNKLYHSKCCSPGQIHEGGE